MNEACDLLAAGGWWMLVKVDGADYSSRLMSYEIR
jgi:hypothetical protein